MDVATITFIRIIIYLLNLAILAIIIFIAKNKYSQLNNVLILNNVISVKKR